MAAEPQHGAALGALAEVLERRGDYRAASAMYQACSGPGDRGEAGWQRRGWRNGPRRWCECGWERRGVLVIAICGPERMRRAINRVGIRVMTWVAWVMRT